jgi:hypothetical protein
LTQFYRRGHRLTIWMHVGLHTVFQGICRNLWQANKNEQLKNMNEQKR